MFCEEQMKGAASVQTRVEGCLLSYDSSWPAPCEEPHGQSDCVRSALWNFWASSKSPRHTTEQLMKSERPQVRQKIQLYSMSAELECLESDLSLFKIGDLRGPLHSAWYLNLTL